MKKLTILLLLLIAATSIQAQYPSQSKVKSSKEPWKFGIKAAGTYDKLSVKTGCTSKLGYKFGLTGEKRLVYNLYFQPSLNYGNKGFQYEIKNGYKLDVEAQFVELEAGLLFKFGDDRLQRGFFLSLTPFVTYGIAGKSTQQDLNPISPTFGNEIEYPTFERNNKADIGFRLGCGYDFNKTFEIAAGYTFGMNKYSHATNYRWRGWNLQLLMFF